ncbi:MAG: preprotein translocase subunit SecG [Planctomycetes bacterium]|nr:preprotein translocase subunit SecG [Planctomycetota bacterium]
MLTLAASTWFVTLTATVFLFVSLLLIAVVLIQKPRGGGLSGAFGGGGGGAQSVFGSKTGDALTWFTCGFFVIFLLLAMALTWMSKPVRATGLELDAPPGSSQREVPPVPTQESPAVPTTAPTTAPETQPENPH